MEMLMEVSFAVGWRTKWRRFNVASTMAMLKSVGSRKRSEWLANDTSGRIKRMAM